MEFARRSSSASAADVVDDGRRFPDSPLPPPHGDSMQMVRDALLSQLQKDRLRQEIIVEELARIERAMALRSAAADAERARLAPFDFVEQFMKTHGTGAVGTDGEASHLKDDGVRQCKNKRSKEHHATEDGLVSESSKTSSRATCEAAGDRKNEGTTQESSDAKKQSPSMKWSCAICQVEAASAGNLLQHFSGQKHKANVDALKAKAQADKSRKATRCENKQCPPWTCKFCQIDCTGKSVLENHLKGKKHHAKIQTLLAECESMERDLTSSQETDSYTSNSSQDEDEPGSVSICRICQVRWSCQSVMEGHVGGKKHRKNFQALQQEAKRLGIIQPKIATTKEQAPPEWDCSSCQVRCNSEAQFQDHCRSMGHVKMEKASHFCKLCNLQCNSAKMLAHHQSGKKHRQAKLRSC